MYGYETFKRAPITEATVALRVAHPQVPTIDDFNRYATAAASLLPIKDEKMGFNTSVDIANNQPLFRNITHKFLELRSADNKYVAQARPYNFSFSRLSPYISWESFLTHTLDAWILYRTTLAPSSILDVSLRYVNRIDLPNPFRAEDYFLTRITHDEDFPDVFSNVFFSFGLKGEEGTAGNVTFFLDASHSTSETISTILQIDVNRRVPLDVGTTDDLKHALDKLRDFKNRIFFLSITEKTKVLFR